MSALPAPTPIFKAFDNNGLPLALGFLTTYAAGTLTKIPSYVDASQTTQNANPVQLNFRGECPLWLDPTLTYKFALTDVLGNTIPGWPVDNIPGNGATGGASIIPTSDNTFTLGSPSFSWANVYVGVNHAPVLDTVSGNIGYYARTAAEIAASVAPTNFAYPPGHVYRYGTNATPGTTDMTTALQNSINAVGSGGIVIWPADIYLTTAPILAENLRGLTIQAASGQYSFVGTRIIGKHTGKTILSLAGSLCCTIGPVVLEGNQTTSPKTGLLLGRTSASNAGQHNFYGTTVQGYYTVVGVYCIASESNCWFGVTIQPSAAPFSGIYLSQSDGVIATIGGLTASSMEDNKFFGGTFGNLDTTTGSAAIFIDAGIATGHIHFYGGFLTKNGGDCFIFVRLGAIDGQGTYFPIGFHDCVGEKGSVTPNSGLHLRNATATDPLPLAGFTATNLRFDATLSNNIICDGVGHIQFQNATITTSNLASGRNPTILGNLDQGCYVNLQAESATTVNEATDSTIICGQGSLTLTTNTGGNVIKNGSAKYQLPILSSPLILSAAATTTVVGQVAIGSTTATTASTGAAGAPPAQVVTYLIINLNGSVCKIPVYNN